MELKKPALRKRTRWIIGCAMVLALACVISYAVFHHYHPTHYRFNDYEVIGHTVEEIIDRYGEPDIPYHGVLNYMGYKVKDKYIDVFGIKYPPIYYNIYFESRDGVAVRVALEYGAVPEWR